MSFFLLQSSTPPRGGQLTGRVLIGRWAINTIVIEDQTVSRIHAWLVPDGKGYVITDGSSYNGTLVNGLPIRPRHPLKDGDLIQIGPEEFSFIKGSELPRGVQPIDLTPRNLAELDLKGGFFVECPCGAPLLVKSAFAGKSGRCRFCRRNHVLAPPGKVKATAELLEFEEALSGPGVGAKPQKRQMCSICQSPIGDSAAIQKCPSCGLSFHQECWTENRGCSAYGCSQVGALDEIPDDSAERHELLQDRDEHSTIEQN